MANQFQKPDYKADLFLPRRKFFHKASRCDISCAVARVQTEIPKVVGKLSGGEPLSIDELMEYLSALKEGARAQPDNWAKGAAVLHRYNKGEIVCEEGDFGSTAFFIVSGSVDIFIHDPLSHLRTKPAIGIFGRSVARMKSFLTDDKTAPRPERGTRQFIGIGANVDLPIKKPLAQLGPGNSHEMACRTYQPRSVTTCARKPCVMIEMLRVILDMLVGNRQGSDLTKATSRSRRPTFKGTCCKGELEKDIVKRVDPHRFFGGAIEAHTMLFRTGQLQSLKGASYSLTSTMLNWSKAIRISRYARRLDPAWMIAS
jgi:CRP-like cAMP-binding protein